MRIVVASRVTWQLVTTIEGATVTPLPTESLPCSPLGLHPHDTGRYRNERRRLQHLCGGDRALQHRPNEDGRDFWSRALRRRERCADKPLLQRVAARGRVARSQACGLYSIGSPRSFTNGTLYSRRIAVIAALIFADELLHGRLPFGLAVADAHCDLIVEFDAGFRL